MIKYEKWLGAGIGWFTGGPVGSMLGYAAGKALESDEEKKQSNTANTSEFETNLIVIIAAVIKADGKVSIDEINFVRDFFKVNFSADHLDEKMNILQHCLQRGYDPRKACDDIRLSATPSTRSQVVNLLFDLALCDGELDSKESDLIFVLAGWLNINDIEFKQIKARFAKHVYQSHYDLLGIKPNAPYEEIKASYRKMVLEYHPDRNATLSPAEQKNIAEKFRKIQEAFDKIKAERGVD